MEKRILKQLILIVTVLLIAVFIAGCENPTGTENGATDGETAGGTTDETTDETGSGTGGETGDAGGDEATGDSNGGGTGSVVNYSIGDTGPAGGLIFFVDENDWYDGWTYLEAAPVDWNFGTSDPKRSWRTTSTLPGSFETGFAVGTGKENTIAILELTGTFPAAALADSYSVTINDEVFDDWFLPSQGELQTMFQTLHRQGLGDFSTEKIDGRVPYWSSYARMGSPWAVDFIIDENTDDDSPDPFGVSATNQYYVRPIRRF